MKKILGVFSLVFLFTLFGANVGDAEEMSYSVQAILPENQKTDVSYFHLNMKPSEEQTLKLKLVNYAEHQSTIEVIPRDAFTNNNGMIDYSKDKPILDKTMKHAFTDLVSAKQVVTLAPKEERELSFQLDMPSDSFDGEILGGFFVQEVDKESKEEKEKSKDTTGVQLTNHFSYTIGVKLSETDRIVKPEIQLGETKAGLVNQKTAFLATIRNTKSATLKNATVEANVYQKDKLVYTTKKEKVAMAPHSVFNYNVSLDNEEIQAGKYTLKLTVTSGEDKWQFDKAFEVDTKEAKQINEKALDVVKVPTNYWPLVTAIMACGIAALLGYIVYQNKRNKSVKK